PSPLCPRPISALFPDATARWRALPCADLTRPGGPGGGFRQSGANGIFTLIRNNRINQKNGPAAGETRVKRVMTMTSGSDNALNGQLLLIDSDGDSARRMGRALSEKLLVAPRVAIAENGRLAAEKLRQARFD